jgi:hypothetical protein
VRRKLYLDGRLVGGSTVLNSITLAGANRFRIGASSTAQPVHRPDRRRVRHRLRAHRRRHRHPLRQRQQGLGASPKNAGDHVEALTATAVYFIGDTLDSQHTIDLGVAS